MHSLIIDDRKNKSKLEIKGKVNYLIDPNLQPAFFISLSSFFNLSFLVLSLRHQIHIQEDRRSQQSPWDQLRISEDRSQQSPWDQLRISEDRSQQSPCDQLQISGDRSQQSPYDQLQIS